jgi:hypothetical protein
MFATGAVERLFDILAQTQFDPENPDSLTVADYALDHLRDQVREARSHGSHRDGDDLAELAAALETARDTYRR